MLCLGWCAHADPAANVTAAGGRVDVSSRNPLALAQAEPPFATCREHAFFAQGFATQVFSSEAEAQLSAHPPPEGIDRAFEFLPEPDVDHWGHPRSAGLPEGGTRDAFWLPQERLPPREGLEPWIEAAAVRGEPPRATLSAPRL